MVVSRETYIARTVSILAAIEVWCANGKLFVHDAALITSLITVK